MFDKQSALWGSDFAGPTKRSAVAVIGNNNARGFSINPSGIKTIK
jgi:hypothetical protein